MHNDDSFNKERLDMAVANKLWLNEFRSTGIDVLTLGRSDHHPILLITYETINRGLNKRRLFCYEAKWAKEDDGEKPIRMVWQK